MGNSNSSNKDHIFPSHSYVEPPPRGERQIIPCIEQVNKFNDKILPKIEAKIILEKNEDEYKTDLKKIEHLVTPNTWYNSESYRNEKPKLPISTTKKMTDEIGKDRFKFIADVEFLAELIKKYKEKENNNESEKCSAFEWLSQTLFKYHFFVKNQLYDGILSGIMSQNDTLVNYKSPREKPSFFMKSKKSKRRSPKRSAKRKSHKSKRRSPKRSPKRKSLKRK